MGLSLIHKIFYPTGSTTPNVPVVLQAMAESVDGALSTISEAPFIVCGKTAAQTLGAAEAFSNILWDVQVQNQGVTHDPAKNSDQFIITESGLYSINARVCAVTADSTATTVVNINGVDRRNTWVDAAGSGTAHPKPTSITDIPLAAGDVVRVRAKCTRANTVINSAECFLSLRKSAGFRK